MKRQQTKYKAMFPSQRDEKNGVFRVEFCFALYTLHFTLKFTIFATILKPTNNPKIVLPME